MAYLTDPECLFVFRNHVRPDWVLVLVDDEGWRLGGIGLSQEAGAGEKETRPDRSDRSDAGNTRRKEKKMKKKRGKTQHRHKRIQGDSRGNRNETGSVGETKTRGLDGGREGERETKTERGREEPST